MLSKQTLHSQLNNTLTHTKFLDLPNPKIGKVRDIYDCGEYLIIITTDRQSAFDRVLASVPFKGEVLNLVSAFWFEKTKDIVANHVIAVPDPTVTIARKCSVFPIEIVVRAYLTGSTDTSAWTLYARGERTICGNALPDGMVKNQKFDRPILTPTTKSELHDEPIAPHDIVERGIIDKKTWQELESAAFKVFHRGAQIAAAHGLILVDTKYEFGRDAEGRICLIDEVHSPDSSRFWLQQSYQERFAQGKEPENIDKEFLRLWFKEHCDPYNDPVLPEAPPELVVELSSRYIQLYEMITGREFSIDTAVPVQERLKKNLKPYCTSV